MSPDEGRDAGEELAGSSCGPGSGDLNSPHHILERLGVMPTYTLIPCGLVITLRPHGP